MIDRYAALLAQACLLPPVSGIRSVEIQDVRPIVDRWVGAPGWDDQPYEQRARALTRFVNYLGELVGGRLPLEWLLFPFNAAMGLKTQETLRPSLTGPLREHCIVALQCYALALQNAALVPPACTAEDAPPLAAFIDDCISLVSSNRFAIVF
ncbi:MAG: hypothetical protein JXB47_04685 [Anaerolineae bacterium]|nr:hypothetical protein [Anaerolineae bacterium]